MNNDLLIEHILPQKWRHLTIDALADKTFNDSEFLDLFKETFKVLRNYSNKSTIDRKIIELVKQISAFIATQFAPVNTVHDAACELTDAMITHCFCNEEKDALSSKGMWCLLGAEIELDFEDADNELFGLTVEIEKLMDMGLWS